MRRKIKRKLAWFLTAVMILSLFPVMQSSVSEANVTEPEYESLSQYNASSDVKVPTVVGESVTLTVAYTNTDDDLHYWAELIDKTDLGHWRYLLQFRMRRVHGIPMDVWGTRLNRERVIFRLRFRDMYTK